MGAVGEIWTHDLQLMRLASYQTAPLRIIEWQFKDYAKVYKGKEMKW